MIRVVDFSCADMLWRRVLLAWVMVKLTLFRITRGLLFIRLLLLLLRYGFRSLGFLTWFLKEMRVFRFDFLRTEILYVFYCDLEIVLKCMHVGISSVNALLKVLECL